MRIGSLCSGYGGLDMAVEATLGGEVAWVADIDPDASRILAHRYPDAPNLGDLAQVDWSSVERVHIVTAGTPCQDVSHSGRRAGLLRGNRSGVWHEAVRAITALRPDLVVIENVLGLLSSRGDEPTEEHLAAERKRDALTRLLGWLAGAESIAAAKGDKRRVRQCRARAARVMGLRKRAVARCRWHEQRLVRAIGTVLGSLADLGLDAEWTVLSAADAGSCHLRKRVFVIAWPAADSRGDEPGRDGGVPGHGARDEGNGPRPGDRGAAEDADGATGGQWREPAPGQEAGGRPRADAGRSGGARVAPDADGTGEGRPERPARGHQPGQRPAGGDPVPADAGGDGREGRQPAGRGPGEHEIPAREPDAGRGAPADSPGDGRHQGRPEPEGIVGGPDAAVRGDATAADAERGGRGGRPLDAERGTGWRAAPAGRGEGAVGGEAAADSRRSRFGELPGGAPAEEAGAPAGDVAGDHRGEQAAIDWGPYELAIRRWERVTGRPAPPPTIPGRTGERLNPGFVEWMQGLSGGWVTDVPGLSRNAMLKALGNGVVPQQAALALPLMLERAGLSWMLRWDRDVPQDAPAAVRGPEDGSEAA